MKIEKELISVVIPTYNEERYLKKCLSSLEQQTYPNTEIIIIDDGSTDKTRLIAAKHKAKIRLISHGGPGNARNIGAKIAKGTILVFIDGDMYAEKHYIENIIKPILINRCDGVYSTAEYIGNAGNIWSQCWNISHNIPLLVRMDAKNLEAPVFRAISRKKFLEKKGFNPTLGYYDDSSLSSSGLKSISVSNAICYHQNPSTLSEVFFSARWIGRSQKMQMSIKNIIRYSIFNSIRISIKKIFSGAPIYFIFFKIVFDFGIILGILFKNSKSNYAK